MPRNSHRVTWALGTVLLVLAISLVQEPLIAAEITAHKGIRYEINKVLMETTFRIEGSGTIGTGFIVSRLKDDPSLGRFVLVTAAHILEGIKDDSAILHLRKAQAVDEWQSVKVPIRIRNAGKALWTKHPEVDVAVMYVTLPEGTIPGGILGISLLADDETLQRFQIHPGDNLSCLGFPLGVASGREGFPILRSGKIASFPLLPTKRTKTFLFDFEIFPGNSGGPVYFADINRYFDRKFHLGHVVQFLVGLVSSEIVVPEPIRERYLRGERSQPLKLAQVVHASLIREAIELLPEEASDRPATAP